MTNELRSMASVYLRRGNEILLLFRQGSRVVNDLWISSAGGHFEPFELDRPRECVLRELEEELKVTLEDISNLKLKYITLRNINNEIRQNYYYFAELRPEFNNKLSSTEGLLKCFDLSELPFQDLPLTAKEVLHYYVTHTSNNKFPHSCMYCAFLYNNDRLIEVISQNYLDLVQETDTEFGKKIKWFKSKSDNGFLQSN